MGIFSALIQMINGNSSEAIAVFAVAQSGAGGNATPPAPNAPPKTPDQLQGAGEAVGGQDNSLPRVVREMNEILEAGVIPAEPPVPGTVVGVGMARAEDGTRTPVILSVNDSGEIRAYDVSGNTAPANTVITQTHGMDGNALPQAPSYQVSDEGVVVPPRVGAGLQNGPGRGVS